MAGSLALPEVHAASGSPIVQVEDLTYRYPAAQRDALDSVSLSVEAGQFAGVVGPNLSGKSTLCYALAGLVPHFFRGRMRGRVRVAGLDVAETPVHRLVPHVGIVFQNPFNQLTGARLTVEDEIAFGLENLGVAVDEMRARVEWAMEQVAVTHLRARNPFALSGGQLQRLAIACVLAQKPRVLVLDEPTSQLDPRGTTEVFDIVSRLRAGGFTVVMVEHKLERLAEHADRILLMAGGKAKAWGTPDEVFGSAEFERCGLAAPAYTRIAVGLGVRQPGGRLPVTIEQARQALVRQLPDAGRQVAKRPHAPEGPPSPTGFPPAAGGRPQPASPLRSLPPRVDVRDLHFAYPGGAAVYRGLDLTLGEPSVDPIAIVGENGAGKTTLVKLITGLLRPDRGEIRVAGVPTRGRSAAQLARTAALVFQNPDDQLFKSRALDEAMFGALNVGVPASEAKRRALVALARVGLEGVAEENPYDLSLGQRKQLALASVLAMQTPILILDEPTIAQDHPGVRRLGRLVQELSAEGRLVVAITHDMEFVAAHFPRVVVLADGEVLAGGPTREVFARFDVLERAGLEPPHALKLARALSMRQSPLTPEEFVAVWAPAT